MPFSHHSHSGQFCPGHAQDSLEDIIKTAIAKNMRVFGLTEHMPRHDENRYPEEIKAGSTLAGLVETEANYVKTAHDLRRKYGDQIALPIGFESEWCGPLSASLIHESLERHQFDYFIGSIHHVRGIPIDYDQDNYDLARRSAGGTDAHLFAEYFEEQFEMLKGVRPPIVGHFDLIRLKSENCNLNWTQLTTIWEKIIRNLDFVASYGGILEINTSALRKGMSEPYPKSEICQAFLQREGQFCLSDDSHGAAQIATNYEKVLAFLQRNNITRLSCFAHAERGNARDARFPTLNVETVTVKDFANHETLH